MSPKSKNNKWADLQLAIAAISLSSVIMLWNMFAGPDRVKAAEKSTAQQDAKTIPTVTVPPEPVVVATMPPLGYTILFGSEAPKPHVIVLQNKGGGGGGGGGPVTSTSSS